MNKPYLSKVMCSIISEVTENRNNFSMIQWNLAHSYVSQIQYRTKHEPEYKMDLEYL